MGSPWKMFTQAQGQELIDNTTNGWITIDEVNGYKFTSKTDSSKYIFLTVAGVYGPELSSAGLDGYYWTSMTASNSFTYPVAWCIYFNYKEIILGSGHLCNYGMSIRAVRPKSW